jgi:hypothetical protein
MSESPGTCGGVFAEHTDPLREHNKALNEEAMSDGMEFWFAIVPATELSDAERRVIRTLKPIANIVRYQKEIESETE